MQKKHNRQHYTKFYPYFLVHLHDLAMTLRIQHHLKDFAVTRGTRPTLKTSVIKKYYELHVPRIKCICLYVIINQKTVNKQGPNFCQKYKCSSRFPRFRTLQSIPRLVIILPMVTVANYKPSSPIGTRVQSTKVNKTMLQLNCKCTTALPNSK